MIADLDQAPKERVEKPVWRVAFFGRLEERKGIKLFVDAVPGQRAALMMGFLISTTHKLIVMRDTLIQIYKSVVTRSCTLLLYTAMHRTECIKSDHINEQVFKPAHRDEETGWKAE